MLKKLFFIVYFCTLTIGSQAQTTSAISTNEFKSELITTLLNNNPTYLDPEYIIDRFTDNFDRFGFSVAVDGNTMVVGVLGEDSNIVGVGDSGSPNNDALSSGAAFVYVRTKSGWNLQAYLKASNAEAGDQFGVSVDIFQDTIVVGARFEDSDIDGVNGIETDNSLTKAGAAYVFTRNNGIWTQQAYLKASNSGDSDWFGEPVAIYGDTIAIGAVYESSNSAGVNGDDSNDLAFRSGAVYVFKRDAAMWSQEAYIKPLNTGSSDQFGQSLDIYQDTLIVGAIYEDSDSNIINGADNSSSSNSGAAYLFTRVGTTWNQDAYIKAFNNGSNDEFGTSVALVKGTIVVGAQYEDSSALGVGGDGFNDLALNSGAVYVYKISVGGLEFQSYIKASNAQENDYFGFRVSLLKNRLLVGAYGEGSSSIGLNGDESNNDALSSGAAYIFKEQDNQWSQDAYLKASNTDNNALFGYATALSEKYIIVGSQFYNSMGAVYSYLIDELFANDFE